MQSVAETKRACGGEGGVRQREGGRPRWRHLRRQEAPRPLSLSASAPPPGHCSRGHRRGTSPLPAGSWPSRPPGTQALSSASSIRPPPLRVHPPAHSVMVQVFEHDASFRSTWTVHDLWDERELLRDPGSGAKPVRNVQPGIGFRQRESRGGLPTWKAR